MSRSRRSPDDWDPYMDEIPDPPMYFGRDGQPITMRQWVKRFNDKRVAEASIGPLWVSTVWLGIDHSFMFEDEPGQPHVPIIFETMVFQQDRPDYSDVDPDLPVLDKMKVHLARTDEKLLELHPELRAWIEIPFRYATEIEALAGHDKICVDLRVLIANIEMAADVERKAIEKAMNDAPNPMRGESDA